MNKLFTATVLYALGFTICAFAVPDPSFYRPYKKYIDASNQVFVDGGKIYLLDKEGWFTVASIKTDKDGVYYTTKFKPKK